MRSEMRRNTHGFSLIEAVVALGVTMVVTASVFGLVNPSQGMAIAEPEVTDLQHAHA